MKKTKMIAMSGLMMMTMNMANAQSSGGVGNGGDSVIGPEFYTIANRIALTPEAQSYNLQSLLQSPVRISPKNESLYFSDVNGKTQVDALSFRKDGNHFTQIDRMAWNLNSCERKYRLTLHELFVLKEIEPSLSYSVSGPIMDQLVKKGLDCRNTGEELARTRLDSISRAFYSLMTSKKEFGDRLTDAAYFYRQNHLHDVVFEFAIRDVLKKTSFGTEMKACFLQVSDYLLTNLATVNDGSPAVSYENFPKAIYSICYRDGGINAERYTWVKIQPAVTEEMKANIQFGNVTRLTESGIFRFDSQPKKLNKFYSSLPDQLFENLSAKIKTASDGVCVISATELKAQAAKQNWIDKRLADVIMDISKACN